MKYWNTWKNGSIGKYTSEKALYRGAMRAKYGFVDNLPQNMIICLTFQKYTHLKTIIWVMLFSVFSSFSVP